MIQRIALVGNPNSGKSSLFNQLTGLHQKTANYPGVTVEKISGNITFEGSSVELIDLPGAYSIHPTSFEERIVCQILSDPNHPDHPDFILYVMDIQNMEKQMLLLSQIIDLSIPVMLVLNKTDLKTKIPYEFDPNELSANLGIPVIEITSYKKADIAALKKIIANREWTPSKNQFLDFKAFLKNQHIETDRFANYQDYLRFLHGSKKQQSDPENHFSSQKKIGLQVDETLSRFDKIESGKFYRKKTKAMASWHSKLDPILTHFAFGPIIFALIMLSLFQMIYQWASFPMDWIEGLFQWTSASLSPVLGDTVLGSLVTEGILPGLAGVMVFIPQIALLFFVICLLEDSGYMARVAYLLDNTMRRFGMSGRSMVALISGGACAIPAIMSTRTISSPKERLITILVTPFIGCSARLPIYLIIISFAIPEFYFLGWVDSRAALFVGLYVLGGLAALITGWILKLLLSQENDQRYFVIELPEYKLPSLKLALITMWNKTKTFILEAGKIIFLLSIILWFLASYGPNKNRALLLEEAEEYAQEMNYNQEETDNYINGVLLESSYMGHLGKFIEPVIRPLGYDWKIGIGLLSSFAAREVFIGTMSTIYSLGGEEGESLKEKMAQETFDHNGAKVYSYATSLSLLIFYVLAMQCMSTLAVVKRETNSWLIPIFQFLGMTLLAYLAAFAVYQFLSNYF